MSSILSTCCKIFSGLGILSIVISLTNWYSFSGLSKPSILNSLINCNCKGSFSNPSISIEVICSSIFSILGCLNIVNSFINSFSFSGLWISSNKRLSIGCKSKGSFSHPNIFIPIISSTIFSSLGILNIVNSFIFSNLFSSLSIASINIWLIIWYDKGSLGIGIISILLISSMTFSGLSISNIVISLIFCNTFSGRVKLSMDNSSIIW